MRSCVLPGEKSWVTDLKTYRRVELRHAGANSLPRAATGRSRMVEAKRDDGLACTRFLPMTGARYSHCSTPRSNCRSTRARRWLASLGERPRTSPPLFANCSPDRPPTTSCCSCRSSPGPPDLPSAEARPKPLDVGSTVGPYRLTARLGRGGMSTVWIAERIDGMLKRRVAIKLPQVSWAMPEAARRMARERDLLGSLEHPNIARLYDAGVGDDGRPYLALELVDGMPIDDYCADAARRHRGARGDPAADRTRRRVRALAFDRPSRSETLQHPGRCRRTGAPARFRHRQTTRSRRPGDRATTRSSAGRLFTPDYASPEQLRGDAITAQHRRVLARRRALPRVVRQAALPARAARSWIRGRRARCATTGWLSRSLRGRPRHHRPEGAQGFALRNDSSSMAAFAEDLEPVSARRTGARAAATARGIACASSPRAIAACCARWAPRWWSPARWASGSPFASHANTRPRRPARSNRPRMQWRERALPQSDSPPRCDRLPRLPAGPFADVAAHRGQPARDPRARRKRNHSRSRFRARLRTARRARTCCSSTSVMRALKR